MKIRQLTEARNANRAGQAFASISSDRCSALTILSFNVSNILNVTPGKIVTTGPAHGAGSAVGCSVFQHWKLKGSRSGTWYTPSGWVKGQVEVNEKGAAVVETRDTWAPNSQTGSHTHTHRREGGRNPTIGYEKRTSCSEGEGSS